MLLKVDEGVKLERNIAYNFNLMATLCLDIFTMQI